MTVQFSQFIKATDPDTNDPIAIIGIDHDREDRVPVAFLAIRQAADGTLWPERLEYAYVMQDEPTASLDDLF